MKAAYILFGLAASHLAGAQTIVWDQGPGTGQIQLGNLTDSYQGPNFVDSVRFTTETVVDTYYHYDANGATHQGIAVSWYADLGGHPGTLLFSGNQGSTGEHQVGTDLEGHPIYEHKLAFHMDPLIFLANQTYWIGASYANQGLHGGAGATIRDSQDGSCALMSQQTFDSFWTDQHFGGGDLMFRLESPVPEPNPAVVCGVGLFAFWRRKRASVGG